MTAPATGKARRGPIELAVETGKGEDGIGIRLRKATARSDIGRVVFPMFILTRPPRPYAAL